VKVARPVRRGEVGKGLAEIPLEEVISFKQVKAGNSTSPAPYPTTLAMQQENDG